MDITKLDMGEAEGYCHNLFTIKCQNPSPGGPGMDESGKIVLNDWLRTSVVLRTAANFVRSIE